MCRWHCPKWTYPVEDGMCPYAKRIKGYTIDIGQGIDAVLHAWPDVLHSLSQALFKLLLQLLGNIDTMFRRFLLWEVRYRMQQSILVHLFKRNSLIHTSWWNKGVDRRSSFYQSLKTIRNQTSNYYVDFLSRRLSRQELSSEELERAAMCIDGIQSEKCPENMIPCEWARRTRFNQRWNQGTETFS